MEIYIYEKLFEYLTKVIDVEKIIETKSNITLILSEEGTTNIAADNMFKKSLDITKDFRFEYKKNKIRIILETINLDRHWLFTMVEFLEKIVEIEKR